MRKRFLFAGVVVALVMPGGAVGQAPTDSVVGLAHIQPESCYDPTGGQPCFAPPRYLLDAHSGPSGENPSGTVSYIEGERSGTMTDRGAVSCLAVTGDRASIGVNFAGFFEPLAHSAILFVEDNGGAGLDKLGEQRLPSGPGTAPSVCPANPPAGFVLGPTYASTALDTDVTITDDGQRAHPSKPPASPKPRYPPSFRLGVGAACDAHSPTASSW